MHPQFTKALASRKTRPIIRACTDGLPRTLFIIDGGDRDEWQAVRAEKLVLFWHLTVDPRPGFRHGTTVPQLTLYGAHVE
jgi:hypothetical protein